VLCHQVTDAAGTYRVDPLPFFVYMIQIYMKINNFKNLSASAECRVFLFPDVTSSYFLWTMHSQAHCTKLHVCQQSWITRSAVSERPRNASCCC